MTDLLGWSGVWDDVNISQIAPGRLFSRSLVALADGTVDGIRIDADHVKTVAFGIYDTDGNLLNSQEIVLAAGENTYSFPSTALTGGEAYRFALLCQDYTRFRVSSTTTTWFGYNFETYASTLPSTLPATTGSSGYGVLVAMFTGSGAVALPGFTLSGIQSPNNPGTLIGDFSDWKVAVFDKFPDGTHTLLYNTTTASTSGGALTIADASLGTVGATVYYSIYRGTTSNFESFTGKATLTDHA